MAFGVPHLSINAHECLSDTRLRLFGSSLFHVFVIIYLALDNVRSARLVGMASKDRASANSREKSMELSFHRSDGLV